MRRLSLVFLGVLFVASTASASTWYIKPDGTGDATTIQAGIDSAAVGDTVLLANGTYVGKGNRNIRYRGKSLTVGSESGDPALCIINCSYLARGFIFDPGDGPGAVLEGITIIRGRCIESVPPADSGGGGIWCDSASPTIRNVTISNCDTEMFGGGMWCSGGPSPMLEDVVVTGSFACVGAGMYCKNSSPVLIDVTFFDNYAGSGGTGGGMCCEGGSPVLTGVRFLENLADWGTGGLRLTNNCAAELRNVTFTGNVGLNGYGGLHCRDSSPLVANCTFSGNWGPGCGGIALEGNSSPLITGCTLFENWGGACGVVCCDGEGSAVFERTIIAGSASGSAIFPDCSPVVLTCCDIYGNSGGDWTGCLAAQCGTNGNFSACPSFCNAAEGDFHLCDESPCAPCNHPDGYDCGLIGAWGVGCSCGPTPTELTTWGSIKAMYK